MTYKKNWVSVCLWAFYALVVFTGYAKALYDVLQAPHVTNHYIQFGIVFFSLALVAASFIQIRKLANLLKRPVHVLWEALIFVLLFAAGIFLRIYFISRGTEHAAYFETAMVNGSPVVTLAHGAQYFYVLLLRGLFLLAGNHFMAGIILQICLQMLAAIVWYLAVKRFSGRTAALALFGGLMVMPVSIWEGLLYSPKMLYMLLCGVVLLMIGRMCRRQSQKEHFKWHAWVQTALAGVGIGVLVYLDVSGILFLVPVLFLPFLNGEISEDGISSQGKRLGRAFLQLTVVLLLALGTFVLLLYMDALQNGAEIQEVFSTWSILFSGKEIRTFPEILNVKTLLEVWVLVVLAFLLLIGVLAFFVRRKEEVQMPWLFFAAAAAVLYAGGFWTEGMDCEYMLLTALLLLAGTGLQAAFCKTAEAERQEEGAELQPREKSTEEIASETVEKEQSPKENTLKAGTETAAEPETEKEEYKEQNQTESDVSQMSYNSEYEESTKKDEQDSLWALFTGDDGAAKPLSSEPEKSGRKTEEKEGKEKEKKEKEKKAKEKKVKEKRSKAAKEEKKPVAQTGEKPAAAPLAQEKTEEKKKNYIENPLPLPKKHVPKTMGYGTELSPDKMDFDIDISEFDDFDI